MRSELVITPSTSDHKWPSVNNHTGASGLESEPMSNSRYTSFLLATLISVCACAATASTEYSESWKKIDFITESGGEVLIEMQSDSISRFVVILNKIAINFPKESYEDLKIAELSKTALVESSGIIEGKAHTIYAVEFPLVDPSLDSEKFEDMKIVHFVIDNGRLIERAIWENSQRTKLVSRIQYK